MKKIILLILITGFFNLLYASNLYEISIFPGASGTELLLETDGVLSYRDYQSGDNIVIDFYGVKNNLRATAFPFVDRGVVNSIGIADFSSSDILRIVIETKGIKNYKVTPSGTDMSVILVPTVTTGNFSIWKASESITESQTDNFSFGDLPRGSFIGSGGLISLDLDQADILTVLRAIADYSGRDIIASPGITGIVTLRLNNITWWQALQSICHSRGYGISEQNGILVVGNQSEFDSWRQAQESAERITYRVYTLEYATPCDIQSSITSLLSERGSFTIDDRTNSIVISDIESKQQAIEDMVEILDRPTPQVEIFAKIIDVNTDASLDLGISWSLTGLDFDGMNIGGSAEFGDGGATVEPGRININIGTIQNFAHISSVIDALEKDGKARTVASPHITVLDNNQATILGGKKFGVPVRGSDGTVTIQFYEAGTRLEVIPHVNIMNEITLEIKTELSDVDVASVQDGRPIITTHEATTFQRVNDGETVALGGFITESETESETGIPILKNIPLIGWLFKNRSTSLVRREVLIFITPHVIKPHTVESRSN